MEAQGLSYSLDPSLLPELESAHAMMMEFDSQLVQKRRASGELHDDLLTALIKAEVPRWGKVVKDSGATID